MKIKREKLKMIVAVVVILLAVFLRFWQIRDYVVFLGDEGRDMIVMRNMILGKRLVFLGPTASVGGFYLGPIYYWMAAPFLALWYFDPVGPSIMVAIFGVATVLLLYKFLKEVAGFWPATLSVTLYATAPLILRYSRSSWNPNPLPFFSLLMMYSIYLALSRQKSLYFLITGLCFGVAIQLHYLVVMLIPISAIIIVINSRPKIWLKAFVLTAVGSFITFSPFLIFELRHGFPNFKTILEFVTRKSTHGYQTPDVVGLIANFGSIFLEEISRLKGTIFTKIVFWTFSFGSIYIFVKNWKDSSKRLIYSIALIWFLGGLAFLRLYSGQIFDYYYGFMFPAPFFLLGVISGQFWNKNFYKLVAISFTVFTLIVFQEQGFWHGQPNRLINQTENVADLVIQKTSGKPFNFALMSEHNSDHAYRYYLEIKGAKPLELEELVANQLMIVREQSKSSPLGYPSWEVAGFGRGEINGQWDLEKYGITVFRLTHWAGAPNPAGKPAVKEK